MMQRRRHLLLALTLALSGCAAHRLSVPAAQVKTVTAASTQPADPKSLLTLDQIEPRPFLSAPATEPANDRPSIDALMSYAQGRDSLLVGNRVAAIADFEKAAQLDPNSYEVQYDLARAYLQAPLTEDRDRAIDAFEAAAAIDPDHLDLQTQLGKQYVAKRDLPHAIEHLRLALQTSQYPDDDGLAAVADYFLASSLKEAGYDRAALDRYEILLQKLKNPSLTLRQDPELSYLVSRPDVMYIDIGELYEKHGQYDQALAIYKSAAQQDPDNYELASRVVKMLAAVGQNEEARTGAAELVARSHASADSLALLRQIYVQQGDAGGVVDALGRLHEQNPQERSLLFAYVDSLIANNRGAEAEAMLQRMAAGGKVDFQLVRRLYDMYRGRGQTLQAARVLISSTARDPDSIDKVGLLWSQLLRPSQDHRLRLVNIQEMPLPPEDEAARQFWLSRIAGMNQRDALARSALEKACAQKPPFGPAYRALLERIWSDPQSSEAQKVNTAQHWIGSAASAGDESLAAELRGLLAMYQHQFDRADSEFAQALKLGGNDADLEYAVALNSSQLSHSKDARYLQALNKLVSDHPGYEQGYEALFNYYMDIPDPPAAVKVLATWRYAQPDSITARLIEAAIDAQVMRNAHASETLLLQLYDEYPDSGEVLDALRTFYTRSGRLPEFISRLEEERASQPRDTDAAMRLVEIYSEQGQTADASRVLDQTRAAVKDDPDLLYAVGQMYARIGQKQTTEDVLEQVLRLDPHHAPAANDLGYSWVDEGRNMDRAETLVRLAVEAEPDNQAFLDSLGWVLYKRGKFAEARHYLDLAVGPAAFPDPVVLDHLGDDLYRLAQHDQAIKVWQRSLYRIGNNDDPDRDELKALRLQLEQKLKQAHAGQPVNVAPTAQGAAPAQAQN